MDGSAAVHCQQVRSHHNLRHVVVRYLSEWEIHFVANFGGSITVQTEVFEVAGNAHDLDRSYHHHVDLFSHRVLAGKQVLGHHVINHDDGRRGGGVPVKNLPSSIGMPITRR